MTGCECIIAGCPKKFTDSRGLDAHFAFVDNPPHPRSKLLLMKSKLRGAGAKQDTGKDYPSNWDSLRREILRRDWHRCQNQDCDARGGPHGAAELHVHHKTPLSKGGTHSWNNLLTLCQSCHSDHHGWSIGSGGQGRPWWHGRGEDLLVQCGRCDQEAILQRNSGNNQLICPVCGEYEIADNQPRPDSR